MTHVKEDAASVINVGWNKYTTSTLFHMIIIPYQRVLLKINWWIGKGHGNGRSFS